MLNRTVKATLIASALTLGLNACVTDDEAPAEEIVNLEGQTDSSLSEVAEPVSDEAGSDFDLSAIRVQFAYDDASVSPEYQGALASLAEHLQKFPSLAITLEGHCDLRGSTEYNLALGERRAQAVKDYLLTLGVNEAQLRTLSLGEERPVALGDSESDHATNRRVEFAN